MRHAVMLGRRHVSYLEGGTPEGRTLVLLHAFPLNADMWRPQLSTPPKGWRVLAPDLAGFGATDDHEREHVSLDDYAADVLAWLDRLDVGPIVLGGLSMGGYVALAIARLAPGRLVALVLADTKAPADSEEARAGRDRMRETLSDRGADGVAEAMLPKLLGATSQKTRPELASEVRSMILSSAPAAIRRGIQRLRDRADATSVLTGVSVPTLVLVGEEDVVTTVADAAALQKGISRATLTVLPGAGHLSSLEAPARFNAALEGFLSTL